MPTTMKNNSWFPGDDHWVAEDDDGHRGSGASPEAAQRHSNMRRMRVSSGLHHFLPVVTFRLRNVA